MWLDCTCELWAHCLVSAPYQQIGTGSGGSHHFFAAPEPKGQVLPPLIPSFPVSLNSVEEGGWTPLVPTHEPWSHVKVVALAMASSNHLVNSELNVHAQLQHKPVLMRQWAQSPLHIHLTAKGCEIALLHSPGSAIGLLCKPTMTPWSWWQYFVSQHV